jgi:hypothetical protein
MPRKVTSTLENLDLNDNDENNTNFKPNVMKDYEIYNHFDHALLCYGIKTQDITSKQIVIQGLEILNFQVYFNQNNHIIIKWNTVDS